MWKVPLAGLLVASTAALGATVSTSRTHVAFVSIQRIAAQTKIGQASAKRLDTARQEKSRALAEKQQKVESLRLQILQRLRAVARHHRLHSLLPEELAEQPGQLPVVLDQQGADHLVHRILRRAGGRSGAAVRVRGRRARQTHPASCRGAA